MKSRFALLLLLVAMLVGAAVGLVACSSALSYKGPASDHFDGKVFRNAAPFEERGFSDLLRWQLGGPRATPWPDYREVPPVPNPPARVERGVRLTFVNHATVLVQLGGLNILTDPVWSVRVGPTEVLGQKRHKPPGLVFEQLPKIDLVVISHNHYDHLDLPTLRRLGERDAPLVLAGLGTARLLAKKGVPNAADLDWWQARTVGNVSVTFAPAQHWSTRGLADRNVNLWGSWYFSDGRKRVYFAGDTGDGPHFSAIRERLGPPDVALIPIGAYLPRWFMRSQHIDPAEAVAAHRSLGAARSVAVHWGTFQQADEGMDDPRETLARVRAERGLPESAFVVLENGESLVVDGP